MFCVINVDMVYIYIRIEENNICLLVVEVKYFQYSYSWNKYDPYGIGLDAPISQKLIHHLSSLFSIIVGYSGYIFNNLISLIFYKCIILIENLII